MVDHGRQGVVPADVESADREQMAMTTTLLSTGAQAAARKWRRALSSAVPSAMSP